MNGAALQGQLRSLRSSADQARSDLLVRLQSRRPEIEVAALSRVRGLTDPGEVADREYLEGMRTAVAASLDYGFAAVEQGDRLPPPIPIVLRAQARLAARNAVALDTVLRRYFAGYTLLADFVIEEAEGGGLLRGSELMRLMRTQAALFDRVIAAVSDEYRRECEDHLGSSQERRVEHVKRLLAGELLDSAELAYDLDASHIGVIATGPGAEEAVKQLVSELDHRLLLVRRADERVWAWIGTRNGFDSAWLERTVVQVRFPVDVSLALGEPSQGLAGWRLSHQQAGAALPIALRHPGRIVRYGSTALIASMLQDDLLATSLRELYLVPLSQERDGGEVARQTLRAYFAAERNVSSASAALGVSRRTVANRLRAIEERLGRSLGAASAELEAALRLHDLGDSTAPVDTVTPVLESSASVKVPS